ncbi:skin secretory protein xP2-like [Saccopteryx leptura]|uniref:skin secretory protein xP2-like n=1 Tax=Saccopteryx leptura TaxID=249018 RepID=UPI00339C9146
MVPPQCHPPGLTSGFPGDGSGLDPHRRIPLRVTQKAPAGPPLPGTSPCAPPASADQAPVVPQPAEAGRGLHVARWCPHMSSALTPVVAADTTPLALVRRGPEMLPSAVDTDLRPGVLCGLPATCVSLDGACRPPLPAEESGEVPGKASRFCKAAFRRWGPRAQLTLSEAAQVAGPSSKALVGGGLLRPSRGATPLAGDIFTHLPCSGGDSPAAGGEEEHPSENRGEGMGAPAGLVRTLCEQTDRTEKFPGRTEGGHPVRACGVPSVPVGGTEGGHPVRTCGVPSVPVGGTEGGHPVRACGVPSVPVGGTEGGHPVWACRVPSAPLSPWAGQRAATPSGPAGSPVSPVGGTEGGHPVRACGVPSALVGGTEGGHPVRACGVPSALVGGTEGGHPVQACRFTFGA